MDNSIHDYLMLAQARIVGLEEQLRQRNFELEVLAKLTQQISYALSDKELFTLLLDQIDKALPVDVCAGLISRPLGDCDFIVCPLRPLEFKVEQEIKQRLTDSFQRMSGATCNLQANAEVLVSLNAKAQANTMNSQARIKQLGSVVLAPMVVESSAHNSSPLYQSISGMLLIAAEMEHAFNQAHLHFLYTVANQGAISLQNLRSSLSAERQRLERIIANLPDGVLVLDAEYRIVITNAVAQTYLSQLSPLAVQEPLKSLGNRPLTDWLELQRAQTVRAQREQIPDSTSQPTPVWLQVTALDAPQWIFDVGLQPIVANEESQRSLIVIRDIRDRKPVELELTHYQMHLEDLVKSRAAEIQAANNHLQAEVLEHQQTQTELTKRAQALEQSNADLEEFTYVISHDLQEPLQAMTAFSQLLQQQYSNQLDTTASNYLTNIVEGGVRMQALIDGILTISRVANQRQMFETVDVQHILEMALANLRTTLADSQATITYDALPTLTVDSHQITQLFQNLISNSVKFRGTELPHIHIAAAHQRDRWIFSVQDNGIGITKDHQERIFRLFQRLHTRPEQDGYGIGLALCKRIVECHQGSIWIESEPNEGATFYFTIPTNLDQRGHSHGKLRF